MSCFLVCAGFCRSNDDGVGVVGERLIVGRGAAGRIWTGGLLVMIGQIYNRTGQEGTISNAQRSCGVATRHFRIPLFQYVADEYILKIVAEKLGCNSLKDEDFQ